MEIESFFQYQLACWPEAAQRYHDLAQVRIRNFEVRGIPYRVQFNPARMASTGAKTDARSISERTCFLCAEHRPACQTALPFGEDYEILVNPFPIFPRHLTIASRRHEPQGIGMRIGELLRLAEMLPAYTVFYNGAACGASAPDHAHFQAGTRGFMPIDNHWRAWGRQEPAHHHTATLYALADAPRSTLVITATDMRHLMTLFGYILRCASPETGSVEPMLNLLAMYDDTDGVWTLIVFLRAKHRPACYTAQGSGRLLVSPASVDMGGVFITPVEADFERITAAHIEQILSEVSLPPVAWERLLRELVSEINCG